MLLTAYNVKTKEKNVPVIDPVITKNSKGRYLVRGHDGNGTKLCAAISEATATAAVDAGAAKEGW
jgi:hypothetical protein